MYRVSWEELALPGAGGFRTSMFGKEITEAYNAMAQHKHKMKKTGEWENLDTRYPYRSRVQINQKWDYHEMFYDMNAFESDVNAQKILAENHQHLPQITDDVTISTNGPKYATGESIFGKVYIPKQMAHFFKGETNRFFTLLCISEIKQRARESTQDHHQCTS